MADLFNIGVSGLRAQQAALAVTGQNITNASTPGYSRQRVEIEAQNAGFQGGDFEGAGARLDRVARITDEFASNQIRLDTSLFAELDTLNSQIGQIEGVLLDDAGGLNSALQSFFGALQTASSSPSSLPFRQLVLSEAEGLADRFQALHARLDDQATQVNTVLASGTTSINELAVGISELNFRIAQLQGNDSSGAANSLLDQRDEMLKELSSHVSVTSSRQSDQQINVFIGKGQALVLGSTAANLEVSSQGEITISTDAGNTRSVITSAIKGGKLGGALEFRSQVLEPALNQLGLLAHAIAGSINDTHRSGVDLNGELGGDLFGDLNAPQVAQLRALGREGNTSSNGLIRVTVDDPSSMPVTDYELSFDEVNGGNYFVKRRSDNAVVAQGALDGQLPQQIRFDAVTLELTQGSFNAGDSYLISPLRDAAASFSVAMKDPSLLAFAGPLLPAETPGNLGSGEMSVDRVFDRDHPIFSQDGDLSPPLVIHFTSPTSYDVLDNTDSANPVALDPPLTGLPYDPGSVNSLLPDQPGTTLVRFAGTDIARLPLVADVTTGVQIGNNGYGAQQIAAAAEDPQTGELISQQAVNLPAGASAREIATQLSSLPGVVASATTQVQLSDFQSNGLGTPLDVAINGIEFSSISSLNDLADRINDTPELTDLGISARSDGTMLQLDANQGDDLTVQIAGDPTDRITLRNPAGESLVINGVGAPGQYRGATIGGSVTTMLAPDVSLSSSSGELMQSDPSAQRADFGFALSMTGRPESGDTFTIDFNASGTGDNRNALKLAGLNSERMLGDPPVSFSESYGELVQFVGVKSSQSNINREAAQSLLEQSTAARDSISGVNLDEEAANLIRYEQAYNAAAQIISVARDVFNTLFSIVR